MCRRAFVTTAVKVRRALSYLWPAQAERDEGFRLEVRTLSHVSLRTIGALEVIVPLLMLLFRLAVFQGAELNSSSVRELLAMVGVGATTSAVAGTNWSRRHARLLAALSTWVVTATLIRSSGEHLMAARVFGPDHYVPGYIAIVMLVAVASIPLLPLQTFGLGVAIEGFYFLSVLESRRSFTGLDGFQHSFVLIMVVLCTVLTATIYAERHLNYRSHRHALAASRRALLSDSAASVNRFAAALSHELNSPLGALISAVDTLGMMQRRRASAPSTEQLRLEGVENSLREAATSSARRLQQVVARMQRFTNLDRAEVRPTDLNELLRDVAGVLDPQRKAKTVVEFDFHPLPPVHCHPQQVSAVFYALLDNALNSIDANGHVVVSTWLRDPCVEVRIGYNGRGMPAEGLASIFEPGFEISESRVTGNWNLFHCRQILLEHGGDIRIDSEAGNGTTVVVTLSMGASVCGLDGKAVGTALPGATT